MLSYQIFYQRHLNKFHRLLDIVRARELDRFGEPLLAEEWTKAKNNSGFLAANALKNWTDMDWFAHRYVLRKRFPGEGKEELDARVKRFMEDPAHQALIATKVDEGRVYKAALRKLKKANNRDASPSREIGLGSLFAVITKRYRSYTPARPSMIWGGVAILIAGASYLVKYRIVRSNFSALALIEPKIMFRTVNTLACCVAFRPFG